MDYTSYLFGWFSGLIVGISLGAYIDRELTRIKWNNTVNETIKVLQSPAVKTFTEIMYRYYDLSPYLSEKFYPTRQRTPTSRTPTATQTSQDFTPTHTDFTSSRPTM